MRFFAVNENPVAEVLVVCAAFPLLKFILKNAINKLISKVGLGHDEEGHSEEEEEAQIQQIIRLTILIEVVFGMPGMCATVLLPWPAFFLSHTSNAALECVADALALLKTTKNIGKSDLVKRCCCKSGQVVPADEAAQQLAVVATEDDNAAFAHRLARDLKRQEVRLSAEDVGEKLVALLGPLVAGLATTLFLAPAEAETAGPNSMDVEALRAVAPSAAFLAARSLLNVAFEVATDVLKNVAVWRAFHVLPARVHTVLGVTDVVFFSALTGSSAGAVIAGVWLAERLA
jgi:hypothetical protein